MQNIAYKAYGNVTSRTAGEKHIEFALFQQITDALKSVEATESPALSLWADAINRNLDLWTALATDILHPENTLADETKQSLLQLAQFVRRTSMQILASEGGQLTDLIEINSTIMAGLPGNSQSAPAEDAA